MSLIVNKTQSPLETVGDVRNKFNQVAVDSLQEIVSDNETRMEGYKKEVKLLGTGIFYQNDYYKALTAKNQVDRINFFKKNGAFVHGFAPKDCFSLVDNPNTPTGKDFVAYQLKPEVLPTDALKALRIGLTFLDCAGALQVAYYEGLRAVLGDEKFNAIFSSQSETPLFIHMDHIRNPLLPLTKLVTNGRKDVGQINVFKNVENYRVKHLQGEAMTYNVLSCDEKGTQFIGLGLKSKGVSEKEISEKLWEEYNSAPIRSTEIMTAEVFQKTCSTFPIPNIEQISLQLSNYRVNFESFKQAHGGQLAQTLEIREDRVFELMQASKEKAVELMAKWKKEFAISRN